MKNLIEGWFDAACEPRNPGGHVGWGSLIKIGGEMAWTGSGYYPATPTMSNNYGEYGAVCGLMEELIVRFKKGII